MKRFLVQPIDYDTRATILAQEINEDWDEPTKELWRKNQASVRANIVDQFGVQEQERKLTDFMAVGPRPPSILAFHNVIHVEVRNAFVQGGYYPAAAGAVAQGERILNHLVLCLRDHFKSSSHYKKVYRNDSFDNWAVPINALEAWKVLLPESVKAFRKLWSVRKDVIHFNRALESGVRAKALEAIGLVTTIIEQQFSAMPGPPWFIQGTHGKVFIKREWEQHPFIREVYLRQCRPVGPYFQLELIPGTRSFRVAMDPDLGLSDGTDEEFRDLYNGRAAKMGDLGIGK